MSKELFLNFLGMTEEQVIETSFKINLNVKELEVFNKGKDFFDNYFELESKNAKDKVVLKLITYGILKIREGNKNE